MTREEVLQALSHLQDPELKRSVVELQFVRDIMVKDTSVSLTFLVTRDDETYKHNVKHAVTSALKAIGAADAHIRFRAASEHERGKAAAPAAKPAAPQGGGARPAAAPAGGSPLLSPQAKAQFIAVASGKGGVGKSTVTVNLAVALARLGKRVGIIDADIYGFSVPDMMGIEERPELQDNLIKPIERHGVKVISMGFFVQDNSPIIWRGPMLGKMLRNFFGEVDWGDIDIMLLDLPPGTGDIALDVHSMLPASKEIIVTTPHPTAAFVAARAGAMARQTNHEIIGVVENMAYFQSGNGEKEYVFGRGGGGKLAEELQTELLAQIPLGAPDNHVSEPDFSPSVYKADHPTGQLYLELARKVIAQL
jgi:ATP-binding protein involved in chromosome partitioning